LFVSRTPYLGLHVLGLNRRRPVLVNRLVKRLTGEQRFLVSEKDEKEQAEGTAGDQWPKSAPQPHSAESSSDVLVW
jgi:hypothetical protein